MPPSTRFLATTLAAAAIALAACVPERPSSRATSWFEAARHGRGASQVHGCDARSAERLATGFAMARDQLRLTAAQGTALAAIEAQVAAASSDLAALCATTVAAQRTLVGEFARAETLLDAGADAIRRIRPSVEAFDATLDDRQRRTLDELLRGHRG